MILNFKINKYRAGLISGAGILFYSSLMTGCDSQKDKGVSADFSIGDSGPSKSVLFAATVSEVMDETLTPGVVILIRKGDQEWAKAFGYRDSKNSEALTTEDHFRIGSNTKTWTGTALLQLVDEGRISLDDSVAKYINHVPNGENISIAQLLTMRSGLFNYSELEEFNRILDEQPDKVWSPQELLKMAFDNEPYFGPGKGFHYSNTNTVLAGLIIEKITGKKVNDVFKEQIFAKLGLKHSLIPDPKDVSMPEPHARGYLYGSNVSTLEGFALSPSDQAAARAKKLMPNDVTDANPSWGWTAGAGISTAKDLANYVKVLVGGGLLSDEMQAKRLASLKATDPSTPAGASYGLALAKFGPLIGHDGSLPGFQSFMGYDPENDVTVIVLANVQGGINGEEPANAIVKKITPILYGKK